MRFVAITQAERGPHRRHHQRVRSKFVQAELLRDAERGSKVGLVPLACAWNSSKEQEGGEESNGLKGPDAGLACPIADREAVLRCLKVAPRQRDEVLGDDVDERRLDWAVERVDRQAQRHAERRQPERVDLCFATRFCEVGEGLEFGEKGGSMEHCQASNFRGASNVVGHSY